VSPPTFSVQPGDQVDFGGWIYLESGSADAVDWVLNTFDANHNLVAAVVPVPWSVTTAGVWTYETGSYTVPPGIAYITFFGQIYQASGTTTARFDDGFIIVGTHYFHPDHLSTRLLTDASATRSASKGISRSVNPGTRRTTLPIGNSPATNGIVNRATTTL
jgi:hypothetical protein